MKTTIIKTATKVLIVNKNEDGTLLLSLPNGEPFNYAGAFIQSMGGIDAVLERTIEIEITVSEWIESENLKFVAEKQERKNQNKAFSEKIEADRLAAWNAIKYLDTIPSTYENIRAVLLHLNTQNWGSWTLPKMSIGYSAHQYDCDGKVASTMQLDEPIEVDGEMLSKFKVGAPRGHLGKYTSI